MYTSTFPFRGKSLRGFNPTRVRLKLVFERRLPGSAGPSSTRRCNNLVAGVIKYSSQLAGAYKDEDETSSYEQSEPPSS